MRRLLAARSSLFVFCVVLLTLGARPGAAQGVWNDPRTRALVELATRRRAEQLADTGLVDYRANARGYVILLASFGAGFLEAPKVVRTDQLALEVYWHAPNLSKQRIIGRRDTLLMPTDIQYHSDHLGIVQNNFPAIIRIGDGDEVRDVPHPLSAAGLGLYDFQLSPDSIRIGLAGKTINLLEVRVRPKDDRQPRVIGSVFIDPSEGQVVRMAFNFTHAAFMDASLEDLAVVLENRLVASRYWLPSRQTIEIRRTGNWFDFPVRGIIRGQWEIGDYTFNLNVPTQVFTGPEIVIASPAEVKSYPWKGAILDSLPPDVQATVDPDIQRVQADARALVRAQALQKVQTLRLSAPRASDFVRVDRVEGLAFGAGLTTKLTPAFQLVTRARYGIDDRKAKGVAQLRWLRPSGTFIEAFGSRENIDIGDQTERSSVVNSLAAQEFGSDMTDPYQATAGGLRAGRSFGEFDFTLSVAAEEDRQLVVHGTPITGAYQPTPSILPFDGYHSTLTAYRPTADVGPGRLSFRGAVTLFSGVRGEGGIEPEATAFRVALGADYRVDFPRAALLLSEQAIAVDTSGGDQVLQALAYFGGPISAPGYPLHSIAGSLGSATRLEVQLPIPFIAVPLGRFGQVPGQAHLAPFVGAAAVAGTVQCVASIVARCPTQTRGVYPYVGLGVLTIFDMLRFDVARGLKNGGWMFTVDVSRDFWTIL